MYTRREFLIGSGAVAWQAAAARHIAAAMPSQMMTRVVPSTGERVPIIGLGGSATFRQAADEARASQLAAVFDVLVASGGKVFDTAAIYGESEAVAGRITDERGLKDNIFWATKVYIEPGSVADEFQVPAAKAQIERSFARIGKRQLDLIQLHDITSLKRQRGILDELRSLKEQGRTRYVGATSIRKEHYADLEQVMREAPIDFIGVDYAIDNREAAERILPLAAERGIAVLAYRPFGMSRLWSRVAAHAVPTWAAEIGVYSWAQFFIKYVAAHPAVTVITPGTSSAGHMVDNLAAGSGLLPDGAMLRRMESSIEAMPS